MARVYVKNDDKWIEVDDGAKLDILDGQCSVLFACKDGVCGSCLVTVLEGAENLEPPTDVEKTTLESLGAEPNQRLLCQVVIKGGEIKVEQ